MQTNLNQTGIAVFKSRDKKEEDIFIPLFSRSPLAEANAIEEESILDKNYFHTHTFVTNNLLDYKIEDAISDFMAGLRIKFLPEDMMEELVSGFPFIKGYLGSEDTSLAFYL